MATDPRIFLAEEVASIRTVIGSALSDRDILRALSLAGHNANRAINIILDTPHLLASADAKMLDNTACAEESDGCRAGKPGGGAFASKKDGSFASEAKPDVLACDSIVKVEERTTMEECTLCSDEADVLMPDAVIKKEVGLKCGEEKVLIPEAKVIRVESDSDSEKEATSKLKRRKTVADFAERSDGVHDRLKNEREEESNAKTNEDENLNANKKPAKEIKVESCADNFASLTVARFAPRLNPRPISAIRPDAVTHRRLQICTNPEPAESQDLMVEPDWFLVGETYLNGLSTCRGKKSLETDKLE